MSCPPEGKHQALQTRLREVATGCQGPLPVRPADMLTLLDYIAELERDNYDAWWATCE